MGGGGKKSAKKKRKKSGHTTHSHEWPLRQKSSVIHKENGVDWPINSPLH